MEVKNNIKTEIGTFPEEWIIDNLHKFWHVTDCKHLTAVFVENGFPVVSIQEVQSRFVNLENSKKTTEYYYKKLIEGGRKPTPGDLIFSRNATVGEVAQVADSHPPFALGQDVCLLRKKDKSFSTDYFQAVLKSPLIKRQLENLMVGSTFKRVNIAQIKNFYVVMPSISEQSLIATLLSDTDALISSLEKLISKKRAIKQGAMQVLFKPKKEWICKKLGELSDLITKGTTPTSLGKVFTKKGINFIKIESLEKNGAIIKEKLGFIDEETNALLKRSQLQENDILFSIAGALGRVALVKKDVLPANTNQALAIIRLKKDSGIDKQFLFYFLGTEQIKVHISAINVQAAQANLSLENIANFDIFLPLIDEQKDISAALLEIDAEITTLELKLEKYRQIKSGMMQSLLTGKIRLV